MKRTERHHLKDNELASQIVRARAMLEARSREVTAAVVVCVVLGAGAAGYFGWREHTQERARGMLAEAMAAQGARVGPPVATIGSSTPAGVYPTEQARSEAALAKFQAAADAYPSTDAGLFARCQQGALLTALGRPADAVGVYQQVVGRGRDDIYSQTAKVGLAAAQARAGQYEQAIGGFKQLAQRKDGALPVDGILMQLGRVYLDAGKRADAQQVFTQIVEEYPDSPFSQDARRELDGLKKG